MDNPWNELTTASPYFAKCDASVVQAFNERFGHHEPRKLQLDSLPEPYVGDVLGANIVCLMSNPGHSPIDPIAHQDPLLRKAMLNNHFQLHHDYPFFPLNPQFSKWPVWDYWNKKLKGLLKHVPALELSKRFAMIEFHPYHSKSFGGASWLRKNPFPSQKYTDDLLQKVIQNKNQIIIVLRKQNDWVERFPELKKRAFFHKNPANISFTEKNIGLELFQKILQCLES